MKIAIIGANGKAGRLLMDEAVSRGHKVLAVVRRDMSAVHPSADALVKDVFRLEYEDIKACDVIIDAFGVWKPELLPQHQSSLRHLADILSGKPNRLIVVGSAGSLYVDGKHKTRLLDSPDIPELYKPLATAMAAAYDELRVRGDVNWTYFSPSSFFDADAPKTGRFTLGKNTLMFNSRGDSTIGYADASIAIIDEAEQGKHLRERFTAVSV